MLQKILIKNNLKLIKNKSKCIDCDQELSRDTAKRCKSCNYKYLSKKLSGTNSANWKGGPKRSNCIDCGKKIWFKSIRCDSCNKIYLSGEKSPNYKYGKPKCKDCNKTIDYRSIRCDSCNKIYFSGKNSFQYKQGKPKCVSCNKELGGYITKTGLCWNCYLKSVNKPTPKCIDCGKKISQNAKRCWFCSHLLLSKRNKKNNLELFIEKLLNKILPNEYKYVGNNNILIERFNPDFINVNGQKKIIEFFGDYWHNKPEQIIRDKRRFKVYTQYGYKYLVIWEKDLKKNNLEKIILDFNKLKK